MRAELLVFAAVIISTAMIAWLYLFQVDTDDLTATPNPLTWTD
ncbi:hypothetical protein [Phyllobacterium lublinensis]|nr:hypothetical protein [Phyllobacterium sp. 2063]